MELLNKTKQLAKNIGILPLAKAEEFEHICKTLLDTYRRKNSDYGDTTEKLYKQYGMTYYNVMLEQKVERLKSVTAKGEANYESAEDTLTDIANYAILAKISLRGGNQ